MELRAPISTLATANILSGRVIRVDAETGLLDVVITSPYQRVIERCEVASTFKTKGLGGVDFKATVGAQCVLVESLTTSPSGVSARPIVIGFRSLDSEARASRAELTPGDMRVQGTNGNDLLLRGNGDVYLVSDQQTMLALLSTEELVRLNSASFEHNLGGGSLKWVVSADNLGGPVAYLLGVKEFASDAAPYLTVSAGAAAAGGLNVTLSRAGAARGAPNSAFVNLVDASAGFHFNVTNEGDVELSAAGVWTQESIGAMLLSSTVGVGITAPSVAVNGALGGVTMTSGGGVDVVSPAGTSVAGPSFRLVHNGVPLIVSDDSDESRRVVNIELLPWLFTHTHATPSGMTLAPFGGPEDGGAPPQADMQAQLQGITTAFTALTTLLGALNTAVGGVASVQLAAYIQAISPYLLPATPPQVLLSQDEVLTADTKVR